MCWEQNAPPGQVMALVRQNLGPNRSLPEGYHDRWDAFAKRWVALFGKELCGSNAAACKRSDDRRPLGFLLRQPSW